jgi:heme exporter protein D
MMPELGKYAGVVLGSYGATILLIAGLVLVSLWQSRRVKARLTELEARAGRDNA